MSYGLPDGATDSPQEFADKTVAYLTEVLAVEQVNAAAIVRLEQLRGETALFAEANPDA